MHRIGVDKQHGEQQSTGLSDSGGSVSVGVLFEWFWQLGDLKQSFQVSCEGLEGFRKVPRSGAWFQVAHEWAL
jgi:hypothetical protein